MSITKHKLTLLLLILLLIVGYCYFITQKKCNSFVKSKDLLARSNYEAARSIISNLAMQKKCFVFSTTVKNTTFVESKNWTISIIPVSCIDEASILFLNDGTYYEHHNLNVFALSSWLFLNGQREISTCLFKALRTANPQQKIPVAGLKYATLFKVKSVSVKKLIDSILLLNTSEVLQPHNGVHQKALVQLLEKYASDYKQKFSQTEL